MRMWFDEAIRRDMGLPNGYAKVSVLLVRWADELDELKTKEEAQELEAVFRERFRYDTKIVELDLASKPQHQLNRHMTEFVDVNDGPNNLLIVYYTGHGTFRDNTQQLDLVADLKRSTDRGLQAYCNWNKAEALLKADDVECDVLTILDTCYASNLAKSAREESRVMEMLCACAIDQTTASGANSFTRALVDALKHLLEENKGKSISTHQLNQHICRDERRHDTPSALWYRLPNTERHILLAPLKPKNKLEEQSPTLPQLPRSYLTLRLALRNDLHSLGRDQIEYLTSSLAKALHKKAPIGLRRVDWVNIKSATLTPFDRAALATYVIKKWRNIVKKKQKERARQRRLDEVCLPSEIMGASLPAASPTRKRTRDELDDFMEPGRKRENLVIPQPPSPPVSNSSYYEDNALTG
ncbi:hypothetical protein CC80DRAFT_521245 [Byssothecium circinans]|uniref:Peptidase C14 caspase domain-containing protein n=1 Tax=Byssothecium circinans TaxID=147558 RepID=A0A6A5T911_9PLEO|nr:hypothetical protein CC80DRAFT_432093 [Byssothecium circinans]KAF1948232.1 hypothetical protein CC80DRAFT_521245 [Byssothecium circinans]